jgi:hypothetical protein
MKIIHFGNYEGVETPLPPDMLNSAAPDWASCAAFQGPVISLNRFAP